MDSFQVNLEVSKRLQELNNNISNLVVEHRVREHHNTRLILLDRLLNLIRRAEDALDAEGADIIIYDRDGNIKRSEFSAACNEERDKIRKALIDAQRTYDIDVRQKCDYSNVELCIRNLNALRV